MGDLYVDLPSMLNGLDLFSGIGGLSLALSPWVNPAAYCEIDRYAQSVLLSRIADGQLPRAPIWDDITSLNGTMLPPIDIVYGGFPCQDISVAGLGKGLDGKRSGLFYELHRLVKECKPAFVFLENVPAIRTRGLLRVVQTLTKLGYDCRWTVVSAAEVGAPHLRKRWFLLANASSRRCGGPERRQVEFKRRAEAVGGCETLADTPGVGQREPSDQTDTEPTSRQAWNELGDGGEYGAVANPDFQSLEVGVSWNAGQCASPFGEGWWESEPDVGRVVNGLPFRVDRIKGLGNSVVPACAREAFKRLAGIQ